MGLRRSDDALSRGQCRPCFRPTCDFRLRHWKEALALYLSRLKPGGCVAFHLTNRFLALDPVVGAIAADLGAPAAVLSDTTLTQQQLFEGKDLSKWAVVGLPGSALAVEGAGAWSKLASDPAGYPARAHWTDDRSDVVGLLFSR